MNLRERIRSWLQSIYFLGQNCHTCGRRDYYKHGAYRCGLWFFDIFLPGPLHPNIGILFFLIFPGILVLGLLLIPLGILIRLRSLRASGKLPKLFPAIDLHLPVVRRTFEWVALATGINLLIVGTAS
jgi:hypothetical protein